MAWQKYSIMPQESRILPSPLAMAPLDVLDSSWCKTEYIIIALSRCYWVELMHSTIKKRIKVSWHDNDLMVVPKWPYKERSVMYVFGIGHQKLTSCPRETDSDFEHILKMRVLHQYKNKNSDHIASLVWVSIPCLAWQMNGANQAATYRACFLSLFV